MQNEDAVCPVVLAVLRPKVASNGVHREVDEHANSLARKAFTLCDFGEAMARASAFTIADDER